MFRSAEDSSKYNNQMNLSLSLCSEINLTVPCKTTKERTVIIQFKKLLPLTFLNQYLNNDNMYKKKLQLHLEKKSTV